MTLDHTPKRYARALCAFPRNYEPPHRGARMELPGPNATRDLLNGTPCVSPSYRRWSHLGFGNRPFSALPPSILTALRGSHQVVSFLHIPIVMEELLWPLSFRTAVLFRLLGLEIYEALCWLLSHVSSHFADGYQ